MGVQLYRDKLECFLPESEILSYQESKYHVFDRIRREKDQDYKDCLGWFSVKKPANKSQVLSAGFENYFVNLFRTTRRLVLYSSLYKFAGVRF